MTSSLLHQSFSRNGVCDSFFIVKNVFVFFFFQKKLARNIQINWYGFLKYITDRCQWKSFNTQTFFYFQNNSIFFLFVPRSHLNRWVAQWFLLIKLWNEKQKSWKKYVYRWCFALTYSMVILPQVMSVVWQTRRYTIYIINLIIWYAVHHANANVNNSEK